MEAPLLLKVVLAGEFGTAQLDGFILVVGEAVVGDGAREPGKVLPFGGQQNTDGTSPLPLSPLGVDTDGQGDEGIQVNWGVTGSQLIFDGIIKSIIECILWNKVGVSH